MAQPTPTHDDSSRTYQRKPLALRLVLLTSIGLCGLLMTFIVASNPRVVAKIQASAEHVSTQFSPSDKAGAATPVLLLGLKENEKRISDTSSAQPSRDFRQQRKNSDHMPFDRIPVRRGGINSSN